MKGVICALMACRHVLPVRQRSRRNARRRSPERHVFMVAAERDHAEDIHRRFPEQPRSRRAVTPPNAATVADDSAPFAPRCREAAVSRCPRLRLPAVFARHAAAAAAEAWYAERAARLKIAVSGSQAARSRYEQIAVAAHTRRSARRKEGLRRSPARMKCPACCRHRTAPITASARTPRQPFPPPCRAAEGRRSADNQMLGASACRDKHGRQRREKGNAPARSRAPAFRAFP